MSAGAIKAGRAYIELYGEDGQLDKTLSSAESKVRSFGNRLAGAGQMVAGSFGTAIGAMVSTAAAAGTAAVSLAGAGLAAANFGNRSAKVVTQTDQVFASLERLQSTGTKVWDFMSAGAGRSSRVFGGLIKMAAELRSEFQGIQGGSGNLSTRLAAIGQRTARRGQWASWMTGDKESHQFYTQARSVADGATIAAAYSRSFLAGITTRLKIGARTSVTSAFSGLGSLANMLTLGGTGAVLSGVQSAARGIMGVGTSAEETAPRLQTLNGGLQKVTSSASNLFSVLKGKAALATGLGAGMLAMLSGAAGFDLTTITSRLMHSKSFASGAEDLHKRGNAMISGGDVANANALKRAMEGLFQAAEAAWAQVGAAVAPLVTKSLQVTTQWVSGVVKWLNSNREVVQQLFSVASMLAKVGATALIAGKVFSLVSMLGPAFGLLLTPAGAIIGLLVGGAAAWLMFSKSGRQAMSQISDWLKPLYDNFMQAWGGIVAAIGGGDLALAGNIAMKGLELIFIKAFNSIGGNWSATVNTFQDLWAAGASFISKVQGKLQKYFLMSFENIGGAWAEMCFDMQDTFAGSQNWLGKSLLRWVDRMMNFMKSGLPIQSGPEKMQEIEDSMNEVTKGNAVERMKLRAQNRKLFTPELLEEVDKIEDAVKNKLAQIEAARAAAQLGGDPAIIDQMQRDLDRMVNRAKLQQGAAFAPVIAPDKVELQKHSANLSAPSGVFNALATVGMVANTPMQEMVSLTKAQLKELAEFKKKWIEDKKKWQGPIKPAVGAFGPNA